MVNGIVLPKTANHKKTGSSWTTRFFNLFMGWMKGLEPSTTEATTQCSTS